MCSTRELWASSQREWSLMIGMWWGWTGVSSQPVLVPGVVPRARVSSAFWASNVWHLLWATSFSLCSHLSLVVKWCHASWSQFGTGMHQVFYIWLEAFLVLCAIEVLVWCFLQLNWSSVLIHGRLFITKLCLGVLSTPIRQKGIRIVSFVVFFSFKHVDCPLQYNYFLPWLRFHSLERFMNFSENECSYWIFAEKDCLA